MFSSLLSAFQFFHAILKGIDRHNRITAQPHNRKKNKKGDIPREVHPPSESQLIVSEVYLFSARATFTAHATVQPTIGLLPMPRKPIIST